MKHNFINKELEKVYNICKKSLIKVYVVNKDAPISFIHISEGENIGYIEASNKFGGVKIVTEHKPSKEIGSGFLLSCDDEYNLKISDIRKSFLFAPDWVTHHQKSLIKKYRGWSDFLSLPTNRILDYKEI